MSLSGAPASAQDPFALDEQFAIKFGFADMANKDAQIYLPMLRQALTAELHFAKRICRPDEKQFNAIHIAGAGVVNSIANTYAEYKRTRKQADLWPDPQEAISAALAAAIRQIMPADVAEKYAAETKARFEANQDANVALMTNVIDQHVLFTADQQDEFYSLLREIWQTRWSSGFVLLMYPQYAVLPESSLIGQNLTGTQKQLLAKRQGRRRVTLSWSIQFGNSLLNEIDLPPFEPPEIANDAGTGPGGDEE